MTALLASFVFVVLAEMGDKTQLLAMAFATRYNAGKVLFAVFLATVLNHSLAVAVGHYLTLVIPLEAINLAAACSFVVFGLWTIRGDTLEGEDKKETRFGPILTVGIAFFLAEMGDKTQLATISLAVEYRSMAGVLMGTTLGMLAADAIGIIIGIVLRKHIPAQTIKWISAAVFVLFGLYGIHEIISPRLPQRITLLILSIISAVAAYAAFRISKRQRCRR